MDDFRFMADIARTGLVYGQTHLVIAYAMGMVYVSRMIMGTLFSSEMK